MRSKARFRPATRVFSSHTINLIPIAHTFLSLRLLVIRSLAPVYFSRISSCSITHLQYLVPDAYHSSSIIHHPNLGLQPQQPTAASRDQLSPICCVDTKRRPRRSTFPITFSPQSPCSHVEPSVQSKPGLLSCTLNGTTWITRPDVFWPEKPSRLQFWNPRGRSSSRVAS